MIAIALTFQSIFDYNYVCSLRVLLFPAKDMSYDLLRRYSAITLNRCI